MVAKNDRDYAVVVGINNYENPDFDNLNGAVNDAGDFVKWLKSDKGGKLDCKNICKLFGNNGQEPRFDQIVNCFRLLIDKSNGGEHPVGRRLYIYFAGHGVGQDIDDTGLLAADHMPNRDSYLVGKLFADTFAKGSLFEEIVLFMDCCRDYDGELTGPYNPLKLEVDAGAGRVRRSYCYGAKFNFQSHEREFDGRYHGVFTWALLRGLEGHTGEGEVVTIKGLKKYVTEALRELGQEPDFPDSDMVLVDGLEPRFVPLIVQMSKPKKGFRIWNGNDITEVIDDGKERLADDRWRVWLRPGRLYMIGVPTLEGFIDLARPIKVTNEAVYDASGERIDHVEL